MFPVHARFPRVPLPAPLLALAVLPLQGCLAPECALGTYYNAECRVAAENHYARLITQTGIELRFHAAAVPDPVGWEPLGLFQEGEDGVVTARPAGLGGFAFSIDASASASTSIELQLVNLAPDVLVAAGPIDALVPARQPDPPLLSRRLTLSLPDEGGLVWVVGERDCPDAYRLAAAGDVQTNPVQFERIVQALHAEVADGVAQGEPLMGMLLLGDLAENATEDEFRRIREILASSPVPVSTIPGNHDIIGEELAIYNRLFGPGNYAFDVCRTRVALLDSSNGDLAPSVEGRLDALVDKGDQAFLVAGTHYPPYAGRTGAGFTNDAQAWSLLSALVRNEASALYTGHVHTWLAFEGLPIGDGTLDQVITGTAGASQGAGQPHFGFTRITFDAESTYCFVEVPEPGRRDGDGGVGDGRLERCPEAPARAR